MVNLGIGAHARGENDRLFRCADVPQEPIIRKGRGSDFVNRNLKMLQEIHGGLVPRRGEPEHLDRLAESVDLFVLFLLEFEAVLEVSVGGAKGILAGFGQLFRGINYVNSPLLELNRVAAGSQGDTAKSLG